MYVIFLYAHATKILLILKGIQTFVIRINNKFAKISSTGNNVYFRIAHRTTLLSAECKMSGSVDDWTYAGSELQCSKR